MKRSREYASISSRLVCGRWPQMSGYRSATVLLFLALLSPPLPPLPLPFLSLPFLAVCCLGSFGSLPAVPWPPFGSFGSLPEPIGSGFSPLAPLGCLPCLFPEADFWLDDDDL